MNKYELNRLMTVLSKRSNPNKEILFWINSSYCICQICNYQFDEADYLNWLYNPFDDKVIYEHAMDHLTQSNLLPFV